MLRSEDRILTTHTGSLPRPAALTALYVRRARGEAIDAAELDRVGKAAVREVVAKQIAAGIDVGNNGEQQREAFFLYVRHRMSGFGGGWTRRVFADVTHYPAFSAWKAAHDAVNESISNTGGVPEAIGEVRYLDRALVEAECTDFRAALDAAQRRLRRTVHDRALARHHRRGDAQRHVRHRGRLSGRARPRAAGGIRDDRRARLPAADRRAGPRDGAAHLLSGPAAAAISSISSNAWWRRSTTRWSTSRATGCACTPAGATTRARTTATWRCRRSCRRSAQAKVGGFVLPFANPRHAHEYRCLKDLPLDDDQVIVAGVIDPLTNFVEHPEVVADRIEHVARAVGDPHARAGRHRLRLRHLGRARPRGGRCGVGEAGGDGGGRADRDAAAVLNKVHHKTRRHEPPVIARSAATRQSPWQCVGMGIFAALAMTAEREISRI